MNDNLLRKAVDARLSGVYALTQPADSVTFTPILPGHLSEEDDWLADDYEPTEEERKMAFTVKAQ